MDEKRVSKSEAHTAAPPLSQECLLTQDLNNSSSLLNTNPNSLSVGSKTGAVPETGPEPSEITENNTAEIKPDNGLEVNNLCRRQNDLTISRGNPSSAAPISTPTKVSNWASFAGALRRGETKHLDLRNLMLCSTKVNETWSKFSKYIRTVKCLEHIDMCCCSAEVVHQLFTGNRNLTYLRALEINDDNINLANIKNLVKLEELHLHTLVKCTLEGDLSPLSSLKNLQHLTLSSVRHLGTKQIEAFGSLKNLVSLELGECNDFESVFFDNILAKLSKLERLRLEYVYEECRTLDIFDPLSKIKNLRQLEIINFPLKPVFGDKLSQCTNIKKLLIVPYHFAGDTAFTNNIILKALPQLKDTLQVFTWGFTLEILYITSCYMLRYSEEPSLINARNADNFIPVLEPVPGLPLPEHRENAIGLQTIDLLPLDKIAEILRNNMPTTKITMVKMWLNRACQQQLVE